MERYEGTGSSPTSGPRPRTWRPRRPVEGTLPRDGCTGTVRTAHGTCVDPPVSGRDTVDARVDGVVELVSRTRVPPPPRGTAGDTPWRYTSVTECVPTARPARGRTVDPIERPRTRWQVPARSAAGSPRSSRGTTVHGGASTVPMPGIAASMPEPSTEPSPGAPHAGTSGPMPGSTGTDRTWDVRVGRDAAI